MGRGFNDDGVSGCQGRSQFPACHGEGEVPGNDLAYYTYRFMENEGQGVVVQHGGRAFPCTEAACKVAEMVAAQGNIGSFGFTDRFAVVQCFHQCQVVCIGINNICDFQQDILSFNRRCFGPGRKSCSCCLHCAVHVFFGCFCEISQVLAICRIVGVKGSAVRSRNEFAVNKESILFLNVCFCHTNTFLSITCGVNPLCMRCSAGVCTISGSPTGCFFQQQ